MKRIGSNFNRLFKRLLFLSVVLSFGLQTALAALSEVRIGVVRDGNYWEYDETLSAIKQELELLAEGQYRVVYPPGADQVGNFDSRSIDAHVKKLLADPSLDLIVTMGTLSALAVHRNSPLNRPVVSSQVDFPFYLGFLDEKSLKPIERNWTTSYDPSFQTSLFYALQSLFKLNRLAVVCSETLCANSQIRPLGRVSGAPLSVGRFEVRDSAVDVFSAPTGESPIVSRMKPDAETKSFPFFHESEKWLRTPQGWVKREMVTIVSSPEPVGSRPRHLSEFVEAVGKAAGVEVETVALRPDNYREKLADLKVELAAVGDLFGFSEKQIGEVYRLLAERKIATLNRHGMRGIRQGAMLTVTEQDYREIGRTYAVKINMILGGIPLHEISILDPVKLNLTFNVEVANQVGFSIPLSHWFDSRLVESEKGKRKMTLKEAVDMAMRENYQIRIDREQALQSQLQLEKTKRGYWPYLDAGLNYTKIDDTRADVSPSPRSESKFDVALSQNLWDPELNDMIDTAKLQTEMAATVTKDLRKEIATQVVRNYLHVLQYKEIIDIRKKDLLTYKKLRGIAEVRYKLKATGKGDVLRVDSGYENARIELSTAVEQFIAAETDFKNLLRLKTKDEVHLEAKEYLQDENVPNPLDEYQTLKEWEALESFLLELALSSSEELQLAEQQVQQAMLERKRVGSQFLPRLEFGASWFRRLSHSRRDFTSAEKAIGAEDKYDDANTSGWSAQMSLNIPIYGSGKRFKEAAIADRKIAEASKRRDQIRDDLAWDIRNLLATYFSNRRRLKLTENSLQNARESFALGRVSYREGSITMMELLDFQSTVSLGEINLVVHQFALIQSMVDLLAKIDKLDAIIDPSMEEAIKFTEWIHNGVIGRL